MSDQKGGNNHPPKGRVINEGILKKGGLNPSRPASPPPPPPKGQGGKK